jgi:hypothetical protein
MHVFEVPSFELEAGFRAAMTRRGLQGRRWPSRWGVREMDRDRVEGDGRRCAVMAFEREQCQALTVSVGSSQGTRQAMSAG